MGTKTYSNNERVLQTKIPLIARVIRDVAVTTQHTRILTNSKASAKRFIALLLEHPPGKEGAGSRHHRQLHMDRSMEQ